MKSLEKRLAAGKALRKKTPRAAHARWKPQTKGRDVIAMLEASNRGRIAALVPERYARMLESPFAFLRGTAAIMAFDLAPTPASGILVQACGDAHVLNFGGFATPERRIVFDLNDFDETLPAPWEWDVKRLAASIAVAARALGIAKAGARQITVSAMGAYRAAMALYAPMGILERWYQRIDAAGVPGLRLEKDAPRESERPTTGDKSAGYVREFIAHYRRSLIEDRRLLLDRYRLVDVARKVSGIGSVGRHVLVARLAGGDDDDILVLQFKEARASVLEPYAGSSRYPNHGQRVVEGQRLMQGASDIFLGWSRIAELRAHFYVRQLRDHKARAHLEGMDARDFHAYARCCARALARAHAKAGDAAMISGYLGKSGEFDDALAAFAQRYADQAEADHAVLARAVREGRVRVKKE